jgi:hypothetical protein
MMRTLQFRPALAAALVLLALAVLVLWSAMGFDRSSAVFPLFIGKIFLGLVVLEVVFEVRKIYRPDDRLGATALGVTPQGSKSVWKEVKAFIWLAAFLLALYLVGFVVAIALYLFSFLRLSAGRSIKDSLIFTSGVTLFVYVVFMVLLGYDLYGGFLFER